MSPVIRKLLVGLILVLGAAYFWLRRGSDPGGNLTLFDPTLPQPAEGGGGTIEGPASALEPAPISGEKHYGPLIVRGRVVLPDGTPAKGVVIVQEHAYLSAQSAPSAGDGSFQLEIEEPRGELVPRAESWLLLGGERRLIEGKSEDYVVVIAPVATVTGTVVDSRGRPLADVALHVLPPGDVLVPFGTVATPIEHESQSGWSDKRGQFRIGPVPRVAGSHVEASATGYGAASVALPDDLSKPVQIVLTARE